MRWRGGCTGGIIVLGWLVLLHVLAALRAALPRWTRLARLEERWTLWWLQ